ncbi:MAG: hypothetical protein Q8L86_16435 [Vicinamibacterales bacterium]|nr:hypothetical protein [Vicinamibacterales bacterium]
MTAVESDPASALARRPPVVWLALSLAPAALMYSSVAQFPYLRADDTFIIRTNWFSQTYDALQEVNLWFVHIIVAKLLDMGRPLFWLSVNATAYLFEEYGLQSFAYIRGIGVGLLGVVGYLLLRHLQAWGYRTVTATCLMALILALPGFQIIIGNGVWLMPGVLLAMAAAGLMMRVDARERRRSAGYAGVMLLLIASLAVYQAVAFLFVAVTAAALASPAWEERRDDVVRYVLRALVLMTVATLVYYALWRLGVRYIVPGVYSIEGSGYAPGMVLNDLVANVQLFVERRIPQVLNLWYAPHISRPLAQWVGAGLVLAWAALLATGGERRRDMALKLLLYATLFAASESCMVVADYYRFFASKFTTSVAQSVVFVFFLVDTARQLRQLIGARVRVPPVGYQAALLALTLVCCVKAQTQTWSLIVMPSSLETRFVGTHVLEYMQRRGRIDEVEIIGETRPILVEGSVVDAVHPESVGEFMFRNFGSIDYTTMLVRNVMLDITGAEPTRVIARIGKGDSDFIYPGRSLAPDSSKYRLVIDIKQMSVHWRP